MKRVLLTLITMFLLIKVSVLPARGDSPTQLIHFNNVTIETMGGQSYDAKKNVISNQTHTRMTIDDVVIEADSLTFYENEKRAVLSGNVILTKGVVTLTANCLTFNMNTGWLEATGNAELASLTESYRSEMIHYNMTKQTGEIGPLQGVVKGPEKDYYVTGNGASINGGTIVITPAGLTRCPRKDYPDYIFAGKRMVIQGNHVYMEKVVFKILGIPLLYFPRLAIRGEEVPRIDLSANEGNQPDLSQMISKTDTSAALADPAAPAVKSDKVHVRPRVDFDINTNDKPSSITYGRIFSWDRYTEEADLNFDSEGIFYLTDSYQIDWSKYNLTVDGKADLNSDPKRELGVAFTKKAWKSSLGNWQVGVFSRLLYKGDSNGSYQGVYDGYRLDYQLTPDFNFSYLHLTDISGTERDWDKLEDKFLEINDYRLGGNFIYSLNIPLTPHYYIFNKGGYSLRDDEWVSQVTGLARDVDCVKIGLGWDFAKDFIELQFK
ncbi:MAG TPA: hypothetical protein DDW65_14960, partial [Firmicutes bacterium]|nr:hypothetical protein [Bacillota bacterium]